MEEWRKNCLQKTINEIFSFAKQQTLAAIPLSGHTKILHRLTGVGNATLAAKVPYPGKATQISVRVNEVLAPVRSCAHCQTRSREERIEQEEKKKGYQPQYL